MQVLSIQSSVAYGHAGNSAATFPLQRLGHEVWPVNTVHFSNHTGYGAFRGMVFDPSDVAEVVRGVEDRGVLGQVDVVLSGYLGSAGVTEVVLDSVRRVRECHREAVYCCDPVLGDAAKGMYVAPDLPELIRSRVVPAADILTPNAFELAYLAGTGGPAATATPADVRTIDGLLAAVETVRATGPRVVLVTSVEDGAQVAPEPGGCDGPGDTGELFGLTNEGGDLGAAPPAEGDDDHRAAPPADIAPGRTATMIAVDDSGAYRVTTPRLPLLANGAGDVTSALFAVHLLEHGIEQALARTASSIYGLLAETVHRANPGQSGVEIALIAAQEAIAYPPGEFPVTRLRPAGAAHDAR